MNTSLFIFLLAFLGNILIFISAEDTKDLLAELNTVLDDIQIKTKKDVISNLKTFAKRRSEKRNNEKKSAANNVEDLDKQLEEIIRQHHLEDPQENKFGKIEYQNQHHDAVSAAKALERELDEIIAKHKNNIEVASLKREVVDDEKIIKNAIENLEESKSKNHVSSQEKIDLEVLAAFSQAEQRKRKRGEDGCIDAAGLTYCYKAAFQGQCNTHAEDMQIKCKRSCRFCCADDKEFMQPKQCDEFKGLGLCNGKDNQDKLRVLCPRTCGFCGRASTEIPCVRSNYGCCWDGSTAQGHLGTPQDKCPDCKDEYPSLCARFNNHCAESWGKAGEQVRRMCPLTCRKCGAHKICRDQVEVKDSCIQMKYDGTCNTFKLGMQYICPKTCDLCSYSTVDCTKTVFGCCADGKSIAQGPYRKGCKECTDVRGSAIKCEMWAEHGACKTNKDRMKVLCPDTCGFCKGNNK